MFNLQRVAWDNLDQGTVRLECLKFCLVLNARQVQPVNLCILQQQRFVGRPEHRMPEPTKMPVGAMRNSSAYGERAARHPAANKRQEHHPCELNSNRLSHVWFRAERKARSANTLLCASSGYSKGCCQAAQSKTDVGPLRPYPSRLVTMPAEAKASPSVSASKGPFTIAQRNQTMCQASSDLARMR